MKKKDIVMLSVAVLILLGAGYIGYTKLLSPQSKNSGSAEGTPVDVIGKIPASLNETSLSVLTDPTKTKDFTPVVDLTTGLGTTTPFGN